MTQELIKSCTTTPDSCNFKEFLQQHIDLAFSKGFDDNVGRHSTPAHFEIPTLSLFFEVANKIHEFFINGTDKDLASLHGLLDTDVKFSRSRCTKVLPRALQAYQENLPQLYTRAYHESKLAHAMAGFEMHARGPLFEEFSEKLQEECEKYWRAGRQMCQVLSLTGNPCTNRIHKGGGEGAGGGEQLETREDFKWDYTKLMSQKTAILLKLAIGWIFKLTVFPTKFYNDYQYKYNKNVLKVICKTQQPVTKIEMDSSVDADASVVSIKHNLFLDKLEMVDD